MNNIFSNYITALRSEHIKIRNKSIYLVSAIIGILPPIIKFILNGFRDDPNISNITSDNFYLAFIGQNMNLYTYIFFPLLIILTVSRITQLDHKYSGWKLMETQPLHKLSIFFSKFCVALIANLISILSFTVMGILLALILSFSISTQNVALFDIPVFKLIHIIARVFIASLSLTALQYVLSVLFSSAIWPIMIGFLGIIYTFYSRVSEAMGIGNAMLDWNPYQILTNIASYKGEINLGYWFSYTEYIGINCSVMILYFGYQWYKFKNPYTAFLDKPIKFIKIFLVLGIGVTLIIFISNFK